PRASSSPRISWKRPPAISTSPTASSLSPAPTGACRSRKSPTRRMCRTIFRQERLEPGLQETAVYDPPAFAFSNGAHVCEVEIDPLTGETRVVGYWGVDDVGTVINPMIVDGQIHGGIAQGLGQALR